MKLDPAGRPFVVILGAATFLTAIFMLPLAAVPAALLVFCLNFFRDPDRVTPDEPGVLVSPADGRVIRADRRRVSIFMNVFDVHVCRAPAAGRITSIDRAAGRFLAAMKDDASEHNERTTIALDAAGGGLRFTLVAGLIARRVVCRAVPGQVVRAGERIGIIRFGSRVDVDLPDGAGPLVSIGDRVVAGETRIARAGALGSDRAAPPSSI